MRVKSADPDILLEDEMRRMLDCQRKEKDGEW